MSQIRRTKASSTGLAWSTSPLMVVLSKMVATASSGIDIAAIVRLGTTLMWQKGTSCRSHRAMRDKAVIRRHGKHEYHTETMKLKAHFAEPSEVAGEGPAQKQARISGMLTPARLLQLDYLLGVLCLVAWECPVALCNKIRDLDHMRGVMMPPTMSHVYRAMANLEIQALKSKVQME